MFFKSKKQKAAEELQRQEKERLDEEEYNRWKAEDEAEKNIRAKADKDAFVSQALESAGADPEGHGMTNRQIAEMLYFCTKDCETQARDGRRTLEDRTGYRIEKMGKTIPEWIWPVYLFLIYFLLFRK